MQDEFVRAAAAAEEVFLARVFCGVFRFRGIYIHSADGVAFESCVGRRHSGSFACSYFFVDPPLALWGAFFRRFAAGAASASTIPGPSVLTEEELRIEEYPGIPQKTQNRPKAF